MLVCSRSVNENMLEQLNHLCHRGLTPLVKSAAWGSRLETVLQATNTTRENCRTGMRGRFSVWVGLNNRGEGQVFCMGRPQQQGWGTGFLYGLALTTGTRDRVSVWVGLNNRSEGQCFCMGRP